MLPDFGLAKARAQRRLLKEVERHVPVAAPLLKGVAKFRQHEGATTHTTRMDDSTNETKFQRFESSFSLSREDMRAPSLEPVVRKLIGLAQEIGAAQTRRMLEVVKEAADEVGNVVSANGELTQETFLSAFARVQMDFDPKTLQLAPGFSFVMHHDMAEKVVPKMKAWEQDAEFMAKWEAIMDRKREDWRDREARRKLVS